MVPSKWKGQVSCCTDPKALQLVLPTRTACSKARGLQWESRKDTSDLFPFLNTVSSFIFKNTPPHTDPRESVVKKQVGFNLQTQRLTPVNLKFLKFRTSSPNVLWEFSPSNVSAPGTALFIRVFKLCRSQLGSCPPAFSRSKILLSRQQEGKPIGSGWGPVPQSKVFYLGCFLLTQLEAPCHMSLDITFIKFLLSARLPSKKGTSMKKTDCLALK